MQDILSREWVREEPRRMSHGTGVFSPEMPEVPAVPAVALVLAVARQPALYGPPELEGGRPVLLREEVPEVEYVAAVPEVPAVPGQPATEQKLHEYFDDGTISDEQAIAIINGRIFAKIEAEYDSKLNAYFDEVAKKKRYDSRYTCAVRAGIPGPFQQEGVAFGVWMDDCNIACYSILTQVLGGQRGIPSWEQLKAELPAAPW